MSAPDIEGGEKALDAALECWERNDMNSDRTRMRDAIAAYHAAHPAPSTGNEGGTACLNAIASNEPCKPDDTLKRCTICGFIVDTKYEAEFPK